MAAASFCVATRQLQCDLRIRASFGSDSGVVEYCTVVTFTLSSACNCQSYEFSIHLVAVRTSIVASTMGVAHVRAGIPCSLPQSPVVLGGDDIGSQVKKVVGV